jgi:hypothetical protein
MKDAHTADHFVCIGINSWGIGDTESKAMRNAGVQKKSTPHGLYLFTHDNFMIDEIDGSLDYKGEAPTIIRIITKK